MVEWNKTWEVETFLTTLFSRYTEGYVEFRAFPPGGGTGRRQWLPILDIGKERSKTVRDVMRWACAEDDGGRDVYVGVLPRRESGTGTKGDILACGWVWADVDFKVLPRHVADETIARLSPELVVDTGGGYHVYNPLSTVTYLDSDLTPKIEKAVRTYQRRYSRELDATHDVSRVLRLPGTHNHKPGRNLAPVRIALQSGTNPQDRLVNTYLSGDDLEAYRKQKRLEASRRWGYLLPLAKKYEGTVPINRWGERAPAEKALREFVRGWVAGSVARRNGASYHTDASIDGYARELGALSLILGD